MLQGWWMVLHLSSVSNSSHCLSVFKLPCFPCCVCESIKFSGAIYVLLRNWFLHFLSLARVAQTWTYVDRNNFLLGFHVQYQDQEAKIIEAGSGDRIPKLQWNYWTARSPTASFQGPKMFKFYLLYRSRKQINKHHYIWRHWKSITEVLWSI